MTTSPNRHNDRRVPGRQDRTPMQDAYDKAASGLERVNPLLVFAINLLRFLEGWDRYFG